MAAVFLRATTDYDEPALPANGIVWVYPKENLG
jgi:hypothetical protein